MTDEPIITLHDLPPPPAGKTGWPWDVACPPLPAARPDGTPWPRISVTTPSYNQGRFLEETIRSVLLQGYPNLEYFVIDGGSGDESAKIIARYAPWLAGWVSERDRGQSDAIAKGFNRSTGPLLAWLNSDDLFLPGALATMGAAWRDDSLEILAGDVVNFLDGGDREEIVRQHNITLQTLTCYWEGNYRWHQPGLFFPRDAYLACGGIDLALVYAMDVDLCCRLFLRGCRVRYLGTTVARFRLHGASKTCAQAARMARETSAVSQRYWSALPHVSQRAHDIYLFGELTRAGLTAIAHGAVRAGSALLRDAYAAQPSVRPYNAPAALVRYLLTRVGKHWRQRALRR